jgi:hypothetical protein
MRTSFAITATVEGNLDEVINSRAVSAPSLQEVLDVLGQLAFVAETAAHLHGLERSVPSVHGQGARSDCRPATAHHLNGCDGPITTKP